MADFAERVAEYGRVTHAEGGYKGLVALVVGLCLFVAAEPASHHDEGQDDAHHAQGIGDGTAECSARSGLSELLERLLGRAECGGVGRGAGEHAQHVLQREPARPGEGEGHEGAEQDHAEGQEVQARTALAEGAHEARAHLEPEGVDKEDQAETLGVAQHLRVYLQPNGAGEDAEEKHVGGTEADALHAQFSQGETRRADEADDDDGLYGRMLEYGF